ncbi:hypothetical protein TRP8649_01966 [Pelagimonas phthalicica]|uniref:Repeat domain-containing protein n=2 Tax=Pelagimonas phthalicica TaxID=1037362 RepID=A0A238JDE5_9RHOB|nr:VCBS repeat-containing protein [Pelagimonas phthalicica]TDS93623.1 hypothetical protein CLV87_0107 [Pelagimonas phthalicica]SMX27856.1 hypothetical protein TRP8649_01966 [Pelagimonas phthalicica]
MGAPRHPLRPLRRLMRGACLALSLWLPGAAAGDITDAYYDAPTTRYAHGVLGDDVEYGGLVIVSDQDREGTKASTDRHRVTVRLPQDHVFEDIAPRLVDLGDGMQAVMVVESDMQLGAQLAIYNALGHKLAETPHIGQRNRWLAPIGAADLDGDGYVEVAYIDRPHLAKTLRIWRFVDGKLVEVAAGKGLSNHRIGWDYIEGGIRDCGQGPEMIVATGDWRRVLAVTFDGKGLRSRALGRYSADAIKRAMECRLK